MALNSKSTIESKLALDVFKLDNIAHIRIDEKKCVKCAGKFCLFVCPAGLFTLDSEGKVKFDYEGCLECGTCLIACRECAIDWNYPRGGYGIQYRYG
jgi:ferredoxin like protein